MGYANRSRLDDALGVDPQSRRVRLSTDRWWGDTDGNSHADSSANGDSNSYAYTDGYCYSNADTYFHAQTDTDAEGSSNAAASPVVGGGCEK